MTPKEASKILEETPIQILNKADVFKYTLAIEIASDALMFKDYFDNFYDDAINWK